MKKIYISAAFFAVSFETIVSMDITAVDLEVSAIITGNGLSGRPIVPLLLSALLVTGLRGFVPVWATQGFVAVINKQTRIKKDL